MIPPIIHQIWIQGQDKIPDHLKFFNKSCTIVNNNFQHMFWDEPKIKNLLKKKFGKEYIEIYDSYKIFAQKADFARYTILYTYGGIYLDMDMLCRKNLSSFLKYEFFCTNDFFDFVNKRYLNGIVGCKPKHGVFPYIFKNINLRKNNKDDVSYSTGTKLLYDSAEEYRKESGKDDITVVNRKYLHPCHTYDDDLCPYSCADCYVAHVNNGSWNSSLVNLFDTYFMKNFKIVLLFIFIIIFSLVVFFYGDV